MFNIGYGSLVWMTATEILPAHIRSSTNGSGSRSRSRNGGIKRIRNIRSRI